MLTWLLHYRFISGKALAITGDVIVVTINYRLGAFGFLAADGAAPLNLGLWDQHMAFTVSAHCMVKLVFTLLTRHLTLVSHWIHVIYALG